MLLLKTQVNCSVFSGFTPLKVLVEPALPCLGEKVPNNQAYALHNLNQYNFLGHARDVDFPSEQMRLAKSFQASC